MVTTTIILDMKKILTCLRDFEKLAESFNGPITELAESFNGLITGLIDNSIDLYMNWKNL